MAKMPGSGMNRESEELEKAKKAVPSEDEEWMANLPEPSQPGEVFPPTENIVENDEFDDVNDRSNQRSASRKRIGLFCFNCNRLEGHFLHRQNRWYYSYLIGLTFGLIKIIGPYQCQCCGAQAIDVR